MTMELGFIISEFQDDKETQLALDHFFGLLREFPNQFDETQLFSVIYIHRPSNAF